MSVEQDKALMDLRREYRDLGVFRKTVRAQVKADFEVKIQQEIQSRIAAAEAEFSRHLAEKKAEHGLKITNIQDEVFKSRTWSIWEKWRDLAGIVPEREASEQSGGKPYRIEDGKITVVRGPKGEETNIEIENVVNGVAWVSFDAAEQEKATRLFGGPGQVHKFLHEEFRKHGDDLSNYNEVEEF